MCATKLIVSLFFAVALKPATAEVSLLTDEEEAAAGVALAADDECGRTGSEHCALSALQLRGQKVLAQVQRHDQAASSSTNVSWAGPPFGHPSASISYPTYPGFTLYLAEEFDEPLDLDTDPIWTWSDGGLSEGQVRFVKEAILFEDGKMKIEVSADRKVHTQSCSNAEVGHVDPKPFTSGEMRTRHNLFRYGRYEARMKAPSVQPGDTHVDGNYISTMFVYRDAKFKHWREIDMEVVGDSEGTVMTNMLTADYTSMWRADIQKTKQFNFHDLNVRDSFHTYAFEWLPNSITWFLDGKEIRRYTGDSLPIPDMSGKIMMNLWIFNPRAGFGGKEIWNNRYPLHNEYEYLRFYAWDGDTHYPCPSMDASCLTSDDQYLSSNNPCDGIPQVGKIGHTQPCVARCGA